MERLIFQYIRLLVCFVGIMLWTDFTIAQDQKIINGKVVEADTNLPIPYVNILYQNTLIGTTTNVDGIFALALESEFDTIVVSAIGFETYYLIISEKSSLTPIIKLNSKVNLIGEIVVGVDIDPAREVWDNVMDRKKQNNPARFKNYALQSYLNIHVTLINLQQKFVESALFRKHKSLLEEQSDTGTVYTMPLYFNEKLTNVVSQQSPYVNYSSVIAEDSKGLQFFEDVDMLGHTDRMSLDANFYENYVNVMERPFASPLHPNAYSYYEFTLEDIFETDLGVEYKLLFRPKNSKDLLFRGELTVRESDWALTSVYVETPRKTNLNFVTRFSFNQTFQGKRNQKLFFGKSIMDADFKFFNEELPLNSNAIAHVVKETSYHDVKLDFKVANSKEAKVLFQNKGEENLQEKSIDEIRPVSFSAKELSLHNRIDSINTIGAIRTIDKTTKMFYSGYLEGNYLDYGPYLEFLKRNEVEGFRFNFTGRTNEQLFKNFSLYGNIGYGTKDNDWKYGLGGMYKFPGLKRRILDVNYRDDLTKLGENGSIFYIKENQLVSGEDNIFASLFSNNLLEQLHPEKRWNISFENEWKKGLSSKLSYMNRKMISNGFVPFTQNGAPVSSFRVDEFSLDTRLSFQEKTTDDYLRRYYQGSNLPILHLIGSYGNYELNNKRSDYWRLRFVANHNFKIGLTTLNTVFEVGKLWGPVPFPLLEYPRNDASFGLSRYSFNLMNEAEYVADEFVSVMSEWHLNGYLFHRLPFLKNTKLREVISFKGVYGNLNTSHRSVLDFPIGTYPLSSNYMEFSAGVENVFQFFRVDAVWRLSDRHHPDAIDFGFRMRFDFKF